MSDWMFEVAHYILLRNRSKLIRGAAKKLNMSTEAATKLVDTIIELVGKAL